MKKTLVLIVQKILKSTSLLFKVQFCVVILGFIINLFILQHSIELILLNENQLLYLFSMEGQIIGGVFALTLTAYTFFADKLRDTGINHEDYYEATLELRKKYFVDLIIIAINVIFSIFLCVIGIMMINIDSVIYPFIINQGTWLFCVVLVSILYFGTALLNPQRIDNEVQTLGKEVEAKYAVNEINEIVNMEEFITAYNTLEKTIINSSEKLYGMHFNNENQYGQFKPRIIQSLKLLMNYEIIDKNQHNQINEIRNYRNSIVHSTDNFIIYKSICNRIIELNEAISKAVAKFNISETLEN